MGDIDKDTHGIFEMHVFDRRLPMSTTETKDFQDNPSRISHLASRDSVALIELID
jgi:hypothetical protein